MSSFVIWLKFLDIKGATLYNVEIAKQSQNQERILCIYDDKFNDPRRK